MPKTRTENQEKSENPAKKIKTNSEHKKNRPRLQNITNSKENKPKTLQVKVGEIRIKLNMGGSSSGTDQNQSITSELKRKSIENNDVKECDEDKSPTKKIKEVNGLKNDFVENKEPLEEIQDNELPSTSLNSSSSLSNKQQTTASAQKPARSALPQQLLTVLSNLYRNACVRLQLDCPPRCAEDLAHCHKQHYQAAAPETPSHIQLQSMRAAQQQHLYISFLDIATDMCCRGVFPGDGIFTNLIEWLLSINSHKTNKAVANLSYYKAIEVFGLIVSTFPPCWLKMRHFYSDFFKGKLNGNKLSNKDYYKFTKSHKIFNMLLDLLNHTLNAQLQNVSDDTATITSPADPTAATVLSKTHSNPGENSQNDILMGDGEYINISDWDKRLERMQTFEALSVEKRLERLFVVLRLILQILENDLVMWILHHHKKTKDWIFCIENRPLVVQVCEMTVYTRLTSTVKQLFATFALAVNNNLAKSRLRILERYIALVMVASNTADMENTVIGVKYPYLGVETKKLIKDFFKIFKGKNPSSISTYINTISLLRIPYVHFEFIDHFLQFFYFSATEEMCPQKIATDIAKKRWLKYTPSAEMSTTAVDEELSREQYLQLLLQALQSYCEWHGLQALFQLFTKNKHINTFRTTIDSVHRWPTHGNGRGVLDLKKMERDVKELMQQLRMAVRMSQPKVDLPESDICIDEEIITKYRNDLKFLLILHRLIQQQALAHAEVDFGSLQLFLSDFEPRLGENT